MIRLLTSQDTNITRAYLDRDPLNNVYLVHGLQTHGLESRWARFWGAFVGGHLEGVLLVDNDSRPRAGYLTGDNPDVLARLGKRALKAGARRLLGKSTNVQPAASAVEDSYRRVEIQRTDGHLWEVHPGQAVCYYDYPVRSATRDDIPLLVALDKNFEFAGSRRTDKEVERDIRRAIDESACFLIELEGRAVSAARIDPETDRAGVIESARTLPEFRGRGMYPCVRTACVEYLSRQGKVALGVLRDTNVAMHKIVDKCGGSLTDPWLAIHFTLPPPLRRRVVPLCIRRWGLGIRDWVWRQ